MKTWKINSSQLAAFITFLMVTPISGISLLNVINTSGVDSYLSVIFMAILGLIPLSIIIYISNYNHDLNIIDINKDIFGKVTNDGEVSFYRGDKKPISKREYDTHINQLVKTGFLKYDVEVFPEFSNKKNLPMNPRKTLFMEEPLFAKED